MREKSQAVDATARDQVEEFLADVEDAIKKDETW